MKRKPCELAFTELAPTNPVAVVCEHGNVLGRLTIVRGSKLSVEAHVVAMLEGSARKVEYGVYQLLGTPASPRHIFWQGDVKERRGSACQCKLRPSTRRLREKQEEEA